MKLNLRLNDPKYDFFNIKAKKKSFQINSLRSITNKTNNYLNQLYSNLKVLSNSKNADNFNTCNSNRLRIISLKNKIFKLKNKNKSINLLFKNNNNENNNSHDNNNKISNKNFILLTSLYKLPVINNKTILNSRSQPHSPIHSKTRNNNISSIVSSNTSQINNANKNFNESNNSLNESFNKFLNVCFNSNDVSKSSNESNNRYRKRRFSSLSSSLKEKYYSDIEKRLNHKLDVRSFPSDHSIKDKIIHMKKVSIFWDCVFRYCCPIINGQKYNFLRLEEQKKLNNIKLSENDLSYISPKRSKNYKKYIIKSNSQPKLYSPKIKNKLFLNINEK